jgi:hypothetical protein
MGEFPYPARQQDKLNRESDYVDWIRQHSSYLNVGRRSLLVGGAASFVLGTFFNVLVLIPALVLFSLFIGACHFYTIASPVIFIAVFAFIYLCMLWAFRALYLPKVKAGAKRRPLQAAIVSFMGYMSVSITLSVATVALSYLLEFTRSSIEKTNFSFVTFIAGSSGSLVLLANVWQSVPNEARMRRLISIFLACLAGTVLIISFVLFIMHFIAFESPLAPYSIIPHLEKLEPWIYVVLLIFLVSGNLVFIWYRRWKVNRSVLGQPTLYSILLVLAIVYTSYSPISSPDPKGKTDTGELQGMIDRVAKYTMPLSEVATLPTIESGNPRIDTILLNCKKASESIGYLWNLQSFATSELLKPASLVSYWRRQYFRSAQGLAFTQKEISSLTELELENLRQCLGLASRLKIANSLSNRASSPDGDKNQSERAPEFKSLCRSLCRELIVRRFIIDEMNDRNYGDFLAAVQFPESDEANKLVQEALNALSDYRAADVDTAELDWFYGVGAKPPSALTQKNNFVLGKTPYLQYASVNEQERGEVRALVQKAILIALETVDVELLLKDTKNQNTSTHKKVFAEIVRRELSALSNSDLEFLAATQLQADIVAIKYGPWHGRELTSTARKVLDRIHKQYQTSYVETSQSAVLLLTERAIRLWSDFKCIPQAYQYHHKQDREDALTRLGNMFRASVTGRETEGDQAKLYSFDGQDIVPASTIATVLAARHVAPAGDHATIIASDDAAIGIATGMSLNIDRLTSQRFDMMRDGLRVKLRILFVGSFLAFCIGYFFVDINSNSLHGFYRDRLAEAFFLRRKDVDLEADHNVALSHLAKSDSKAPYNLINAALNLQASRNLKYRDSKCDFFIFSGLFCGNSVLGYVPSVNYERRYRKTNLATAMAISAAAASPNMGANSSPPIAFLMTWLNIRLGFWLPNPSKFARKFTFDEVFKCELNHYLVKRWLKVYGPRHERSESVGTNFPTTEHSLIGVALSGGGIRSASCNLGMIQSLNFWGVFEHVDYISSVSGGGYTACGLAVSMLPEDVCNSPQTADAVPIACECMSSEDTSRQYRLPSSFLFKELTSILHEEEDWVYLSDGGHIENLAAIELLRRKCKFIILGDAEEDRKFAFNGLGKLIRHSKIELDVDIDISVEQIVPAANGLSKQHHAIGLIKYPGDPKEHGILLYLKSSLSGDESLLVTQYYRENAAFPHEPTNDQFFSFGQFDAYRELGQHTTEQALREFFCIPEGATQQIDFQTLMHCIDRHIERLAGHSGTSIFGQLQWSVDV